MRTSNIARLLDPDKWDWAELTTLQKILLPVYGVIGALLLTAILALACLALG